MSVENPGYMEQDGSAEDVFFIRDGKKIKYSDLKSEKIAANSNWSLAGIYADQGKPATSTKQRDSFNDMIADCYDGKIDMIQIPSGS